MVVGLHQGGEDKHLGTMARGRAGGADAALKGRQAFFEGVDRGVGEAGIGIAEFLQSEQIGGVRGIAEDEGSREMDRHGAGAGVGVRRGAGMQSQGFKAFEEFGGVLGHENPRFGECGIWVPHE